MDEKNLTTMPPHELAPAPQVGGGMTIQQAERHWHEFREFVKNNLRAGVDFGTVGGGDKKRKPGLFRPGAEKILKFYGMGGRIRHTTETVIDWKQPFFHYACEATVFRFGTNQEVATAQGSANSLEDKFRWQWLSEKKVPRSLKIETLEYEDREYDGRKYKVYRCPVSDPFSQVNNIDKRAGKRALVAAVLIACAASDFFSQDEEGEDEQQGTTADKSSTPAEGGEQKSSAPANAAKPPISEKQLSRLHAIRNKADVSEETLHAHLKEKYPYTVDKDGVVHASAISWKDKDYETVCTWLENA